MTTKKLNILILGDGYMGNHIFNHLIKEGFGATKKSSKELDYHDSRTLYKYLINNGVCTVINCSGFTGRPNIDEAEIKKELCYELNVLSPLRVNKICNTLNVNYLHISSGCIYDGYEKEWSEEDKSNYGLFTTHSSFYSKSKHSFELLSQDLKGTILRIRMPFGPDSSHRNYLSKIRKYDNLINFQNSKTYIPDLCGFISTLLDKKGNDIWLNKEIYNIVNPSPLWTNEVCDIMKDYGFHNQNWKYVALNRLEIATSRSNCIMNNEKASKIYKFKTERESLWECFETILKEKEEYNKRTEEIEEKYKIS